MTALSQREARRAIAFARALARHAGSERGAAARVAELAREDAAVARAARLLDAGSLWAVSPRGSCELERLRAAYGALLDVSTPAGPSFRALDEALAQADASCARARGALEDPAPPQIDLIAGEDRAALETLERDFLSAFCHVVAALYGTEPLGALAGVSVSSLADLRHARDAVERVAGQLAGRAPLGCWTITRCREGGVVLPVSYGYVLDWAPGPLEALERAHDLRRAAPYLCVARGDGARVVMAGRGNVVGTPPLDSVRLRDAGVVRSIAPAALVGRRVLIARPLSTLRDALGGDAFCLAPEAFARALNRWAHAGGEARAS